MAESNKICCSKYCKPPIYCTLINRVPQYTGLQFYPPKQALCVNQCKLYPDLPCFSNYWARFLSPRGLVNQGFTVFRWVATIFYHRKTLVFIPTFCTCSQNVSKNQVSTWVYLYVPSGGLSLQVHCMFWGEHFFTTVKPASTKSARGRQNSMVYIEGQGTNRITISITLHI